MQTLYVPTTRDQSIVEHYTEIMSFFPRLVDAKEDDLVGLYATVERSKTTVSVFDHGYLYKNQWTRTIETLSFKDAVLNRPDDIKGDVLVALANFAIGNLSHKLTTSMLDGLEGWNESDEDGVDMLEIWILNAGILVLDTVHDSYNDCAEDLQTTFNYRCHAWLNWPETAHQRMAHTPDHRLLAKIFDDTHVSPDLAQQVTVELSPVA